MNQNDRGAALIQVALGLLAMIAFSTFVMDYGLFWTARREAQNSADAAAHAGAVALAFDNQTDTSTSGAASQSAYLESQRNSVWGQSPSVVAATDITFPTSPTGCTDGLGNPHCVRVDVYRTVARGNALPIFFGTIVNLTSQDVRATATAMFSTANATDCLKPWGVPDLYVDTNGDGDFESPPDVYIDPTHSNTTGYTLANSYGAQFTLKGGPGTQLAPGWFDILGLTDSNGGSDYRTNIGTCVGTKYGIGDIVPVDPHGVKQGPTKQGVDVILATDPDAVWNPSLNSGKGGVSNSCVTHNPYNCPAPGLTESPRIVDVPVFDPLVFATTGNVKIVNILGFFLDHMSGKDVIGYLVTKPDLTSSTNSSVPGPASFLSSVQIIR